MPTWTSDELKKIGGASELQIAPRRANGTLQNPVTIWVVRHDNDLYVRSYNGRSGSWFRAAQKSKEGHIRAGGVDKDVRFVEADSGIYDEIDAAYRNKYERYSQYVAPMIDADSRKTTLKLVPKE